MLARTEQPPAQHSDLTVSIGQASRAGRSGQNKDFHGVAVPDPRDIALKGIAAGIADGISTSELAGRGAEIAVRSFLSDYYATPYGWSAERSGRSVIAAANAWLHAQGQRAFADHKERGFVTTFSGLILKGRSAFLFHAGDSRIARIENGALTSLTNEHRLDMGGGEVYLGRALGAEPTVEIDYRQIAVSEGDLFLLTTDGFHDHLPADTARRLSVATDLTATLEALIGDGVRAGAEDDATAIAIRIDALPHPGSEPFAPPADLGPPRDLSPGDLIDGFRIVRQIHHSARSRAYLAIAPAGERVVLKVPSAEMCEDTDHIRRFVLEEWIANRVSSEHVTTSPDRDGPPTALYTVSQEVPGRTLRQMMLDEAPLDLETVRDLASQIAAGLRALHRQGMIHQDLRPENVMVTPEGRAVLIDLGAVAVPGIEEAVPGLAGVMPGTFQYTAPEYFTGDAVSPRSDQFALGVIAYELLTGALPYGAEVAKIASRRDQQRLAYRPAREIRPDLPPFVEAALKRACHPDPVRRYAALSELIHDLHRPGGTNRLPQEHRPLAERHPVAFWRGAAAILAVLLAVSLLWR